MNSASSTAAPPIRKPIKSGLFEEFSATGPQLKGSRCRESGEMFWPAEAMNPRTHRAGTMEDVDIEGRGKLISYAIVARGLPGFPSPYAIATIELDAGPSLIAQLEDWQGRNLTLGMPVQLVIGLIRTDKAGTQIVGPKFRPLDELRN